MLNSLRISTYLENHPEFIVKWAAFHKEWLLDNAALGGVSIAKDTIAFVAWCTVNRLSRVDFCTDFDPNDIVDGMNIGGKIAPYVPTLIETAVATVKKFFHANHYQNFQDFNCDHPHIVNAAAVAAAVIVVVGTGTVAYKVYSYWFAPILIPTPPPLPPVYLTSPIDTPWLDGVLWWLRSNFVELAVSGLFCCVVVVLIGLILVIRAIRRL